MSGMADSHMTANQRSEGNRMIVTFGSDYGAWTTGQLRTLVRNYADADACLSGAARVLEFRSPSGTVVAMADGTRGIQMK
jgi:hypothetical protein